MPPPEKVPDNALERAAEPRPRRAAARVIGARLARLRLAGLPASAGTLVVAGWILIAVLLGLLAIPGLLEAALIATLDPPTPKWVRVVILAGCAVVAAGSLVAAVLRDTRTRPSPARVARRDLAAGIPGAAVGGLLLASDVPAAAIVALTAAVATVIALHLHLSVGAKTAVVGLLGGAPWVAALAAQFAQPDFGLFGWVWIILLPGAAGLAAFGALYGTARAAETRVGGLRRVFRDDVPRWGVALVVVAALGIVVTRYSILSGLFGDYDAQLWTFRVAPSWIHAALVAAAIVAVALVSTRRPFTRIGRRVATAGFGVAAALELVLLGPLIITIAVSTIVLGAPVDPSDIVIGSARWVSVGIVVLLVIVVAHPVFAGSAGRWMTWLGAFYALPGGVASAAGSAFDDIPAFWAKPPQVAALVALGVGVLLVVDIVQPRLAVPRRLMLRLAVIPLVAVHATALLPAPWESTLGRAVVLLGVVAAVLFFAPAATADPTHRGERLLRRATAQLAGLVVFVLALPSVLRGETFEIVGTLWLAIPVAAALCFTVLPRTTPAPARTPEILVDAESGDDTASRRPATSRPRTT